MAAVQPIRKQSFEQVLRLVKQAIFQKSCLTAYYGGYRRLLAPHILGRTKDGVLQVLAYQYGGESRSGLNHPHSPENWRCIALEKLTEVALNDDRWHTPANHSRAQTCIATVDYDANIPSTLIETPD